MSKRRPDAEPSAEPLRKHQQKANFERLKSEHKHLLEQLHEANARNTFIDSARTQVVPSVIRREKTSRLREATAFAPASDWHVEEIVLAEQCAGINEYDTKIAEKRAQRWFAGVLGCIEHNRSTFKIRDLVMPFMGDLLSGYIHEELLETNELSPVETVLFLKGLLISGVTFLLRESNLERIIIPCDQGNHGRVGGPGSKRKIKTNAINSFEWLLYNILQSHFEKEKRVQFVIDRSNHHFVKVYDFGVHTTHGDELKFGGGIGGLSVPYLRRVAVSWDRLAQRATGAQAVFHMIGHFHQQRTFGRAWSNGSLIGYNEYALSVGAEDEEPRQFFTLIDSKKGQCQTTSVWVDGA